MFSVRGSFLCGTGPWHTDWVLGFTWDFLCCALFGHFHGDLGESGTFVLLHFCRHFVLSMEGGVEVQVTCYMLYVCTGSSSSVMWIETSVPHSDRLSTSTRHPRGSWQPSLSSPHRLLLCFLCPGLVAKSVFNYKTPWWIISLNKSDSSSYLTQYICCVEDCVRLTTKSDSLVLIIYV